MRGEAVIESIGRRYQILGELGRGGMGTVYRVRDRLDGFVALKQLLTTAQTDLAGPNTQLSSAETIGTDAALGAAPSPFPSGDYASAATLTSAASPMAATFDLAQFRAASGPAAVDSPYLEVLRLTLAREFRVLASLRHPNIISVLDYGFDDKLQPYFTMELLDQAQSILRAGHGQPLEAQLLLIGQMLQALAYLHRRGVIHRDLKPGNVLVEGGRVKVLDFGVSIRSRHDRESARTLVGTLAYMAPELLLYAPASEASDLYAVGIIAYELFAGAHPFSTRDVLTLQRDIMDRAPDLARLDARVAPVVGRLLAKDPEERYGSVAEVIAALRQATGVPLALETAATRDSFLQAAELCGRDGEVAELTAMLGKAMQGKGGGVLVGGESGVGKSRLLDELRVRALVEGAVVLRGQAVSEGASPYHVWRDVLRWMVLLSALTDHEASVLEATVPEIAALLDRDVPSAPDLDPEATQIRLLSVVEDVLRRQTQPILMILEDLHWAGAHSIKLLARIVQIAGDRPLLVVGSYRDDERAGLPSELPAMKAMKLARLTAAGVAELSVSMLGEAGRDAQVIDLMRRETEGNPFFLVEVVRALAEEAGGLGRVGASALPERVLAGGMHVIIKRRLGRVPDEARPLLQMAAVLGRQIDPKLLRQIDPAIDLDSFFAACANVAVLEVYEGAWRFSHDKLREALLAEMSEGDRRSRSRAAAAAIEAVYPGVEAHATALAYHFRIAGDEVKEAHYAVLAGEQALAGAAYPTAAGFFERALALMPEEVDARAPELSLGGIARWAAKSIGDALSLDRPVDPSSDRFRRGRLEGLLAEAHYRQGDMRRFREHGERALRHLGLPMPPTAAGLAASMPRQIALRAAQSFWPGAFAVERSAERAVLQEAARIQGDITSACLFAEEALPSLWSGLRVLNLGDPAGPSTTLVAGYGLMGMVAGTIPPLRSVADAWGRRSLELGQSLGGAVGPLPEAVALVRKGVYGIYVARWKSAEEGFVRAGEIAARVGDYRQWEEATALLANVLFYQARFAEAEAVARELLATARRHGHRQPQWWATSILAQSLIRSGRAHEIVADLEAIAIEIDQHGLKSDVLWAYAMIALARLSSGDPGGALETGARALAIIKTTRPVSYWNQQSAFAVCEVMLTLLEAGGTAAQRDDLAAKSQQACDGMRGYGQVFPFAEPAALLWGGLGAWHLGRRGKARKSWDECVALSRRLGMPYEEGRGQLEIGRHLPPGDRERRWHLLAARDLFARLGAAPDLARAEAELGGASADAGAGSGAVSGTVSAPVSSKASKAS